MVQVDRPDLEIWVFRVSAEVSAARVAWVEVEKATLDFERSLQQPSHSEPTDGTILARADVSIV